MRRLAILDYSRFIAALMVVFYHYTFNGMTNGKVTSITFDTAITDFTKYGYLGVELFFMISGYVIFLSANGREAVEFAVGRARRLYPAYWFAILFTSCFAYIWGGDLMSTSLPKSIANLSMLQSFFNIGHVDGVYWTLVYEITFYFAVFVLLFIGLKDKLAKAFELWPVLFCVALLLGIDGIPLLGGYYYYFSAGAVFALIGSRFTLARLSSLALIYLLCINYSTNKANVFTAIKGVMFSEVVIATLVTLFFFMFSIQNLNRFKSVRLPLSSLLGRLTYPLYLIHAHFGYMLLEQFANEQNKYTVLFVVVLVVLTIAYAINKYIEINLKNYWVRFFDCFLGTPLQKIERKLFLKSS